MKRKAKRSTKRWSDRSTTRENTSVYRQPPRPTGETGNRQQLGESGLGPYESTYDVSLGYGHDRSIILP
ncbi:MAG TPA: hypothetical protein VFZ24_09370 [Longimicrobiales bacterium]